MQWLLIMFRWCPHEMVFSVFRALLPPLCVARRLHIFDMRPPRALIGTTGVHSARAD